MSQGFIYVATSPSGKSYVGKTCDTVKNRLKEHLNKSKTYNRPFYKAINKYGIENFKITSFGPFDERDLNNLETYYI